MKRIKRKKTTPLIILTAGGTGGHVYPAEALAEELSKRGYRLMLVTDNRGKDNYKGKLGQIPNKAVWAGSLVGKSVFFKIKSLFKLGIGVLQALHVILKEKPVCVVGFGGYASFPCCVAAILTGTDLVIHEQNSVMSRTNRFLSKYATLIAQSFKKVKYAPQNVKAVLTGMPVRANIVEAASQAYPKLGAKDVMQVLVLGGSQGAKVFAEVVPAAVQALDAKQQKRLKIVQQCRQDDVATIEQAYKDLPVQAVVSHFFDNMPELYTHSHVVISRAGASSVSEIAVVGVPSILVPLPTAADNHQTGNAAWLADAKGAELVAQSVFTAEKLKQMLQKFFDEADQGTEPSSLEKMARNAKKVGITDAAVRLADAIEKEIVNKRQ